MRLAVLLAACLFVPSLSAQQEQPKLAFDIVSVRENKSGIGPAGDEPDTNVPLGPGNVYSPTGGQFNTRNIALLQFVDFAWRLSGSQRQAFQDMVPTWARDAHYDIRARTDKANVTKDELRLMVQSLLKDRFGLAVHFETRTSSVYVLQFVKQDVFGPHFRRHTGGCPTAFQNNATVEADKDGYPSVCGGVLMLPGSTDTRFRIGARDMPVNVLATSLTGWGDLGRPVVNGTGLTGNIDFLLEFLPPRAQSSPGADADGPSFQEALHKQLGLRLEPQKQPVQMLLLDHIERPSEN